MEHNKKKTFFLEEGADLNSSLSDMLEECSIEVVASREESSKLSIADDGNIFFNDVDWKKVRSTPVAFIKNCDFEKDISRLILKRFLGGEGSLASDENYENVLLKSGTFKVLDGRGLGGYSDILAAAAELEGLNLTLVRNFSVQLFSFIDYLSQKLLIDYPLEVDYGRSQDCFFIQAHCEELGVFFENLLESSEESNQKSPFASLLREMLQKVSFLEIYKLNSSQKLVISAVWNIVEEENIGQSLLIHQIDSFRSLDSKKVEFDVNTFFSEDSDRIHKIRAIEKTPQKMELKEKNREIYNPALIKRLATFLRKKKTIVEAAQSGALDEETFKSEISKFPDKEALSGLGNDDYSHIKRIIADGDNDISQEAETIKGQISEDDYFEGIVSSLEKMTADEAKTAIGYDEDELVSVIKGGNTESDENDFVRVSGKVDVPNDEVIRIKGVSENLKDGPWHVKRLEVANTVKEKLNEFKAKGMARGEVDKEIKNIIASELNLKNSEGDQFISALSDDVADDWVRGGIDPINDAIKQRVRLEKAEGQLKSRDHQISKMKQLIDSMKGELLKKQGLLEGLANPDQKVLELERDNQRLQNELTKAQSSEQRLIKKDEIESRKENVNSSVEEGSQDISRDVNLERYNEKLKSEISKIENQKELLSRKLIETKQQTNQENNSSEESKIDLISLERELHKISNDLTKVRAENELLSRKLLQSKEEIGELRGSDDDTGHMQSENTNLKAQVESLKKRLSFMYENSKANKEIALDSGDVQRIIEENERLKDVRTKISQELELQKEETRELEQKSKQFRIENDRLRSLVESKKTSAEDRQLLIEKDRAIEKLSSDLKRSSDEGKALHLKIKSYEQKVKFMTAQIDKSSSKKGGVSTSKPSVNETKLVGKLKHSETMNIRLKEAADKLNKELGEKKTELHKMKMENKVLNNKMKDLAKKINGKKAA